VTNQMWFVVPAVLFLLYLLRTAGRKQKALVRGDSLIFGASREAQFTILGAVALGAVLIGGPALQTGHLDEVTAAIGGALILSAAALSPSVLAITPDRIEAKWWWGKRTVLPWRSAEAALYDAAKQDTTVYGDRGLTVKHTRAHVDGARFRSEVARRVKQFDGLKPGS
jgi:hypothetical protein